jgi:3-hydroxyisobutyrate dehydrogenase-like beta-hydroxyacid dehydrogenase
VSDKKAFGILGLGLVGMALAKRLLVLGYEVHGFDIRKGLREPAIANSVIWHDDLTKLERRCEVVVLAVLDDAALVDCANAIGCETPRTDRVRLVVSCVTASQQATLKACAQLLTRDIAFVDLPLLGSSQQIERGDAIGLLGASTDALERWQPLLNVIAPNLRYVGDVGLGVAAKLACNLILGLNRSALAEGMALAKGFGIEPSKFLALLQGSPAYSKAVDVAGSRMAARNFEPVSRIVQHRKDVGLILDAARELQIKAFLGEAQAALLDEAIERGFGDLDNVAVIAAYDQQKRNLIDE